MSDLRFAVVGAAGPKRFFSRLTPAAIAHGYLFTGPQGVGKKTFARRLAQSLLCEASKEHVLGYDGTCSSCRLFSSEETRHPDFLENAGALKIGDTDSATGFYETQEMTSRDLVRQFSLQSYAGGFRVVLLGDVEFATHNAANALLKFFEEAPARVVLLLTTATPGRLIETIRSRLVEVRFPPLRHEEVRSILLERGLDAKHAQLGAALSQGSATRAIAALQDGEENLRAAVAKWFFEVVGGKSPDETWATRETLDEGLEILKTFLRDWIALGTAGEHAPLLAVDFEKSLGKLPRVRYDCAVSALAALTDTQRIARTNVSPGLVGELARMCLSGLAQQAPATSSA